MRPGVLLVAAILTAACGSGRATRPRPVAPTVEVPVEPCGDDFAGRPASFALDRAGLQRRAGALRLVQKLDASVYRYFRMLGPAFAARACGGVSDVRWRLPLVAVHGDAHVGQFVVTGATYGIEDFDQAGFGPAVVDLVRYAASLHMACREIGYEWCRADDAVAAYFRTYREALDHPDDREAAATVPSVVERLRQSSPQARSAWLTWAGSLMMPLPPDVEEYIRERWHEVSRQIAEVQPQRSPRFCEIVRFGGLEMGVGSLLERKILVRVRGETDAAEDDFILEARSTPIATGRACAWRPPHGGALHSLMMMSILGRRMPEVYGFGAFEGGENAPQFWLQSWDPGYQELAIRDIRSQAELEELATDAARQLAGHFWTRFPDALRAQQRVAQLEAFDLVSARARTMARELAAEVVTEWERFRSPR